MRRCSHGSGWIPGPCANPLTAPSLSPHLHSLCSMMGGMPQCPWARSRCMRAVISGSCPADPHNKTTTDPFSSRIGKAMVKPPKSAGSGGLPFGHCLLRTPLLTEQGNPWSSPGSTPEHLRGSSSVSGFIALSRGPATLCSKKIIILDRKVEAESDSNSTHFH